MTTIDQIKNKLAGIPDLPRYGWDNPAYENLETPARMVVASYQNAQRWLDTIKESVLIDLHCPYFSNILHQLAHSMPVRFDKFGDILHTENLIIYYPGTDEWTEPVSNIPRTIELVFNFLDDIRRNLYTFKKMAESLDMYSLSIMCDPLVTEIQEEYQFYVRVLDMYKEHQTNIVAWDARVYKYWQEKE